MSKFSILCLVYVAATAASPTTREERLERRQQSAAYKRARSNLDLQFIAEFLRVEPLTSPPVKAFTVEFDPSGLLEAWLHKSAVCLRTGILGENVPASMR